MTKLSQKAFTLTELLVVIVILSVLATIGFVIFSSVQSKARDAKIAADFKMIQKMVTQATVGGRYLKDVTGSQCTICGCRFADGVVDITQNPTCIAKFRDNWNKILNAAGYPNDATPLPLDPYGNLYSWDENEGEVASGWNPTGCETLDTITMAGPNHSYHETSGNDDKTYRLMKSVCR